MYSGQLPSAKEQNLADGDICHICNGSTFIPFIDEYGVTRAKECECRKKIIMKNRLRFANIPVSYSGMQLKTFSTSVYKKSESKETISIACESVKFYLENFDKMNDKGMGLYFYSSTKGSGKTRMMASIANELMNNNVQVKFAVSTNILQEIKNTWEKDSEYTESRLLDYLATAEVLMIDDFGTEKYSEWVNNKFYQIINERYVNSKVTILTSNSSLKNIAYDDRITNRLMERTYEIQFPEESIREYIAEKNNAELLESF